MTSRSDRVARVDIYQVLEENAIDIKRGVIFLQMPSSEGVILNC